MRGCEDTWFEISTLHVVFNVTFLTMNIEKLYCHTFNNYPTIDSFDMYICTDSVDC